MAWRRSTAWKALRKRDIQRAIRDTEAAVDSKVARYRNNPLVATVAKGAKETFHKNMLDQAKKK